MAAACACPSRRTATRPVLSHSSFYRSEGCSRASPLCCRHWASGAPHKSGNTPPPIATRPPFWSGQDNAPPPFVTRPPCWSGQDNTPPPFVTRPPCWSGQDNTPPPLVTRPPCWSWQDNTPPPIATRPPFWSGQDNTPPPLATRWSGWDCLKNKWMSCVFFWKKHDNVYIYQPISVVYDQHGIKHNSVFSYLVRLGK